MNRYADNTLNKKVKFKLFSKKEKTLSQYSQAIVLALVGQLSWLACWETVLVYMAIKKKKRPLWGPEDCRFYGLFLQTFSTDWPLWKNKGKKTVSSLKTTISYSQLESSPANPTRFLVQKLLRKKKKRTYFIISFSCTQAHIQGHMLQPRHEPSTQGPAGSLKISDWVGILLFLLSKFFS